MRFEKLENISDVFSGLVLSRFSSGNDGKEYKCVTLKSLEDNYLDEQNFDTLKIEREVDSRYFLKRGDILFKLSPPYSTTVVDDDFEDTIVPSSIAIIRIKDKEVEPKYISFIMSSNKFKNSLKGQSEGSNLIVMKVLSIKNLEFKITELEKQKEYCTLVSFLLKKEKFRKNVMKLEDNFKHYILDKMVEDDIE